MPYDFQHGIDRIDSRMDSMFGRILEPIGDAIRELSDYIRPIEAMYDMGDEVDIDVAIFDEVRERVHLLGLAYVSCQVYITRVESEVRRFHEAATEQSISLSRTSPTKRDVIRHAFVPTLERHYSPVEVLNAAANYYKHRESWPRDLAELTSVQRATADVVEAAGGRLETLEDLVILSAHLGNPHYDDLGKFLGLLGEWRERLLHDYRIKLRRAKLL